MAKVNQRTWKVPSRRTKRKAWGYTTVINGTQRRCYKTEWTKEDAEKALAELLLNVEPPKKRPAGLTLAQATEKYLATRTKRGNPRSKDEQRTVEHLKAAFGEDTPLVEITAARISDYKASRVGAKSERTKRPLTAAAVNRPLAVMRHLLHLANVEWEMLERVPRIKLETEPEGKIVWLEPDEETRLLEACRASRSKHLADLVTVALESGLRKGELVGLTWERVDLSRGVLRMEKTKSGRRREVPMRQAVYNVLAARRAAAAGSPKPDAESRVPEPSGRVWPAGDIRTAFENAVVAAKLDRLDGEFTMHGCRHHFASWFAMRGGSLPALQKLLGHATLAMTMRYAHLAPDYVRAEVAKTERPSPAVTQTETGAEIRQEAGEVTLLQK